MSSLPLPSCSRCFIGVDDDGDGNCAVCVRLPESSVVALRLRLLTAQNRLVDRATQIARDAAFEEMRLMLQTTRIQNPLLAIDAYRSRYPKHGDLDRERERTNFRVAESYTGPVLSVVDKLITKRKETS